MKQSRRKRSSLFVRAVQFTCCVAAGQEPQRKLGLNRAQVAKAVAANVSDSLVCCVLCRHQRHLRENYFALLKILQRDCIDAHTMPAHCTYRYKALACVAKSPLPLPPPASGRTSTAHPPRLTACKGDIDYEVRGVRHIYVLSTPQRACLPERSMLLEQARLAETTAPLLAHPTAQQPSLRCQAQDWTVLDQLCVIACLCEPRRPSHKP